MTRHHPPMAAAPQAEVAVVLVRAGSALSVKSQSAILRPHQGGGGCRHCGGGGGGR